MMRKLLAALLLIPTLAFAQESADPHNTLPGTTPASSSYSQIREFLRDEDAERFDDMFQPFVVTGGTHATAGGLSSVAFATEAYVSSGYRVNQSASAITYPNNDICWVIAHYDQTGNITTFTRVSGTHYLIDCTSSTQPSLPSDSTWLMKVTTSAGAITVVTDLRDTGPVSVDEVGSATLLNVMDYCADNTGVNDNSDCFTTLFNIAGAYYIPDGTYRLDRHFRITLNDNVYIKMSPDAVIEYDGECSWGGVVIIRNADNIWLDGFTVDGNSEGNDNLIAVTGQAICEDADFGVTEFCTTNGDCTESTQTGICRTDKSKNIKITNAKLRNARAANPSTCDDQVSASIGEGGGKGISLQFGIEDLFIDNVVIDNADIGLSVECKSDASFNGGCENFNISNVSINDSEWMCLYLLGSAVTPPTEGDFQPINMTNIHCNNCAVGKANQGVVTAESAFNYDIDNLRIRNTSGSVTPWRGLTRQSNVDMYIDAFTIADVFNFTKAESANGSASLSRYNKFRAYLKIRDDVTGFMVTHDGTNAVMGSEFDVSFLSWDGANFEDNGWPGATQTCSASLCQYATGTACTNNDDCGQFFKYDVPETVHYRIQNLSRGDVVEGQGPISPVASDTGEYCQDGITNEKDASAGVVAARVCDNDYIYGLRSLNSATQLLVRNEGIFLGGGFGDNSALTLSGTDVSPDVTDDWVVFMSLSAPTTVVDFEDAANTHAALRENQMLVLVPKNGNTTLDCSASDIICNGGVDCAMASGEVVNCVLDKANEDWYCDCN